MKKIVLLFITYIFCGLTCFADDESEVRQFFNDYVNAANSYDSSYFNYYSDSAKIIRVVEKPDGSTQRVDIPIERYKSEVKKSSVLAKLRRYKNKYLNIRISKLGSDYKLSVDRMPSTSAYKVPAHFVIGKDEEGEWKIKEESMNTKVQRFLNEE